ncbi:type II secretion system F family protein [Vibrio sp. SCSIO 43137]|uniref:type II secretion system F family protein n=1 Tax=Vibrio sp. SCSIO 43137 TaxID=3021011 RepID=UPI002306F105|nr:type II secretion system F family protein [Vibrio sp. SCSIO 43137]WCE29113.1 type II secretion system F family protein [Vibrio sp. SCSIO 43137]
MQDTTLFLILLFFSIVFISQALLLPAAGQKAKHKELAARLRESQRDLDEESKSLLQEQYLKGLTPFEKRLIKFTFFSDMKKMLELSGTGWGLSKTLGSTLLISLIVVLLLILIGQVWIVALGAGISVWILMFVFLNKRISGRLAMFEEQLPEALDIIRRVLQAGQPLNQAFNEVGEEMPPPIGVEFKNTFNLLNYGYDLRLAILQMADRTPTVSMLAFSSAVLLQKETGGNLTENLQKVSDVLRGRFKLARKIKTLSAEARMSAWILTLSPFILYLGLRLVSPDYVAPLHEEPIGLQMVMGGIVLLFLGSLWIRKIINIGV